MNASCRDSQARFKKKTLSKFIEARALAVNRIELKFNYVAPKTNSPKPPLELLV